MLINISLGKEKKGKLGGDFPTTGEEVLTLTGKGRQLSMTRTSQHKTRRNRAARTAVCMEKEQAMNAHWMQAAEEKGVVAGK